MAPAEGSAALTNGEHAAALLRQITARLVSLHAPVLEDRDPEPLHQMRVSMRRLRAILRQFGPALVLPAGVSDRRIGRVGRRLGVARDLDVLRELLEGGLLPELPEQEGQRLRPVLKQLRRERKLACEDLAQTLRGSSYLRLLSRLQRWQNAPRTTEMGGEPLAAWLLEWQAPVLAPVFAHPAWFVAGLQDDPDLVHDLRKRCKEARYTLENLLDHTGPRCAEWVRRLKRVQQLLGDLNDLRVLRAAIDDALDGRLKKTLPELHRLLGERSLALWQEWRGFAEDLLRPEQRHGLLRDLLVESGAAPPVPA